MLGVLYVQCYIGNEPRPICFDGETCHRVTKTLDTRNSHSTQDISALVRGDGKQLFFKAGSILQMHSSLVGFERQ